ncbi:hypothetical protein C8R43DRAFT_346657 [Mycena crocata]|nr:hypothetical protein C8R43DRAFT_346657 [Mycena crocata]
MAELSDSSLEPARKRQRLLSYDVDADATLVDGDSALEKLVQDPLYYFNDADCKIRVENTLFSIHRFLLTRDSSVFATLFQLPQDTEKPLEGSSDQDPIVLTGDTAEQFHALCWALYALPDEISKQRTNKSSMVKLARVATIAHKYHLLTYSSWSMASIHKRCTGFDYLSSCSVDELASLFSLFLLYALIEYAQNTWIHRLEYGGLTTNLEDFPRALDFAVGHGLRQFIGRIYYTHLVVNDPAGVVLRPHDAPVAFEFPYASNLDPDRLQCLLLGY